MFNTDVLRAGAKEQRIALRENPVQSFDYSHLLYDNQIGRADGLLRSNAGGEWYVPVWHEAELVGNIASAATSISVDTTIADYRALGKAIVWEDDETYALVDITTVGASSITLSGAVGTDLVNAYCAPVRTGFNRTQPTISPFQRNLARGGISFEIVDQTDLASAVYDSYESLRVVTTPFLAQENPNSIGKAQVFYGNAYGKVVAVNEYDYDEVTNNINFFDGTRSALWTRRQFYHAHKGRQKAFWLPTFKRDLDLVESAGSGDPVIVVTTVGDPTTLYIGRHIGVFLRDGTRIYREITGVTNGDDPGTKDIQITALGVAVAPADVLYICFVNKVRSNTDTITFEHRLNGYSIHSLSTIEVPD
ncbi:MAG TPA: hypothetical protein V6D20_25330 [Candidatus Obscuribacterales bacterium]